MSANLEMNTRKPQPVPSLGIRDLLQSVAAAALGVQSAENRERDFKNGRAGTFIVAGIIFTALFIGTVFTVVQLVLAGR